jgi:PAS domain S-box-containing protein
MSFQISPTSDVVDRLTAFDGDDDPLAAAIRGTRMALIVTDARLADHPITFANDAFCALTGYAREEVLGRNCRFLQGPGTDPLSVARVRQAIREGRDVHVEMLNYRKSGEAFWNGLFISPVRNSAGEIIYFFGSQLDVTSKKQTELALLQAHGTLEHTVEARTQDLQESVEQKTVLLHEVEHRVKNNLQLISSLIQYQARRTADPVVKAALGEVQERVSALSTVHRRLFQSEDAARFDVSQFLRDIVDDLLGRTGRQDIAVAWRLERVDADAARAAPLALLINEVLAHMMKGGLPPGPGGKLRIELSRTGERMCVEIADGSSLEVVHCELAQPAGIVDILQRQLGAKIEWRDNQPGVSALISMPIESR